MERMRSDLVPFISDPNAALALAKVLSATWTPLPAEAREGGVVRLQLIDVIRGPGLSAGASIEISGKRLASEASRDRERRDRWNSLAFAPGDLLLMALRPGTHLTALAADPVESPASPVIAALHRTVEIERIEPVEARRAALWKALTGPQELVREYAIDALGRRALVSRAEGAGMLARALTAGELPASARSPLVSELVSLHFFRNELGADAVNVQVIGSLAALVAGDAAQRPLWAQYLGACLTIEFSKDPAKDAETRRALIRGVTETAPRLVIEALEQQVSAGNQDPRVPKLLEAWRAAQR